LLIRFLKAERHVGQGVLQDSYGRMGKMGLNFDIERLSYRSHCLFSSPPLPGHTSQHTPTCSFVVFGEIFGKLIPIHYTPLQQIPSGDTIYLRLSDIAFYLHVAGYG